MTRLPKAAGPNGAPLKWEWCNWSHVVPRWYRNASKTEGVEIRLQRFPRV